jgi:hypothetical protein
LTSFLARPVLTDICLEIEVLFMGHLLRLLREDDFYYVCYSLNLIGKIARNHRRQESETNREEYFSVIRQVLGSFEDFAENHEQIVAVKYVVFNQLVEAANEPVWRAFAFEWVRFTCAILNVGLIRHKKSKQLEAWLQAAPDVQEALLASHSEDLAGLARDHGCVFYLLYLLPAVKARIVQLPGVRETIYKELALIPHASM